MPDNDEEDDTPAARLSTLIGDALDAEHDAAVVKIIRVRRRVGCGSIDDPHRVVTTYHSTEGGVLFEDDPESSADSRVPLLQAALAEALEACASLSSDPTLRQRCAMLARLTDPAWRVV